MSRPVRVLPPKSYTTLIYEAHLEPYYKRFYIGQIEMDDSYIAPVWVVTESKTVHPEMADEKFVIELCQSLIDYCPDEVGRAVDMYTDLATKRRAVAKVLITL